MKTTQICYEVIEFEQGDIIKLIDEFYEDELSAKIGDEFVVTDFWEPDPGIGREALVFLEGFRYGYSPNHFEFVRSP